MAAVHASGSPPHRLLRAQLELRAHREAPTSRHRATYQHPDLLLGKKREDVHVLPGRWFPSPDRGDLALPMMSTCPAAVASLIG